MYQQLPELEETLIIYPNAEAVWGLTLKLIRGSVMAKMENAITFVKHLWKYELSSHEMC